MKKIITLLLSALFTLSAGMNVSAVSAAVPADVISQIVSDYCTVLRSGGTYVDVSGYGITADNAYNLLYGRLITSNGEYGGIIYGKYSETYVVPSFVQDEASSYLSGIALTYSERYRNDDGSCNTFLAEKDRQTVADRYNAALSLIDDKMSDIETALVLYDFVITAANYPEPTGTDEYGRNIFPADAYTVTGLLCDSSAVCTAYAKLYAILLNEAGIPAVTVYCDEIDHEWVMLRIGGEWYHADPTWDDPRYESGSTAYLEANADAWDIGAVSHTYFLKSDAEIAELGHPSHNISFSVNPDELTEPPVSGDSDSFSDLFFADPNADIAGHSPICTVNGKLLYIGRNGQYAVKTNIGGETEILAFPEEYGAAMYCFEYAGELYIMFPQAVCRMDTETGICSKILEIPEEKQDTAFFSEMNIKFGIATLISVQYNYINAEQTEYDSFISVTDTYDAESLMAATPIDRSTKGDFMETKAPETTLPDVVTTPPETGDHSENAEILEGRKNNLIGFIAAVGISGAAALIVYGTVKKHGRDRSK